MGKEWDARLYDAKHSFVWKYGLEVIELLAPQPGERILDLGCGTGHLTNRIAESGAVATGLDVSADMIRRARANYPHINFVLGDGRDFRPGEPLDAVFSNAAIHWMPEPERVARCIHQALKPGGRFVAEFGGKRNIHALHTAIRRAMEAAGCAAPTQVHFRYYPTIGEYASLLERTGFVVTYCAYFDRPTPLEGGEQGLRSWMEMFASNFLDLVPVDKKDAVMRDVEEQLRGELFRDGTWYADYRRIRVAARKSAET